MAILDHRGNPIDTGELKREIVAEELSRSGGARSFASDHPSIGLTPGGLAALLRESEDGDPVRYFALAEEMEEKDLHYLSVLGTRKRQVAQLDITVEAASDAKEDEINADLVRAALEQLDEDSLFDMLDAVGKGVSLTEIIWTLDARQWMPERFEWVDPRMIDFDDATRRQPMLKTIGGLTPLAPFKFIAVEMKAKSGLPVRGGIARAAGWSYLFKNFALKDWVRFAEAYGQPLRVGKYAAGASEAEKRSLLRSVAALGSDAAAIIPQSMLIEFIEAKSQGSAADLYQRLATYCDHQVSKAVLGQTATTDAIAGGHAVGKEHNEVREDIERADAKTLARALGHALVKPLVDLNRGQPKTYPKIIIGRPEQADATLMIQAAEKLVPLGLKVGMKQILAAVGLKEPEEDDELLGVPAGATQTDPGNGLAGLNAPPGGPSPQNAPGGPGAMPPLSKATARAQGGPYSPYSPLSGGLRAAAASRSDDLADPAPERDQFDALAEQLLGETMDEQTGWIDQIRAVVEDPSLTSLAAVGRKLLAMKPSLDAEGLASALGDAMVLAELAGRADIAGP